MTYQVETAFTTQLLIIRTCNGGTGCGYHRDVLKVPMQAKQILLDEASHVQFGGDASQFLSGLFDPLSSHFQQELNRGKSCWRNHEEITPDLCMGHVEKAVMFISCPLVLVLQIPDEVQVRADMVWYFPERMRLKGESTAGEEVWCRYELVGRAYFAHSNNHFTAQVLVSGKGGRRYPCNYDDTNGGMMEVINAEGGRLGSLSGKATPSDNRTCCTVVHRLADGLQAQEYFARRMSRVLRDKFRVEVDLLQTEEPPPVCIDDANAVASTDEQRRGWLKDPKRAERAEYDYKGTPPGCSFAQARSNTAPPPPPEVISVPSSDSDEGPPSPSEGTLGYRRSRQGAAAQKPEGECPPSSQQRGLKRPRTSSTKGREATPALALAAPVETTRERAQTSYSLRVNPRPSAACSPERGTNQRARTRPNHEPSETAGAPETLLAVETSSAEGLASAPVAKEKPPARRGEKRVSAPSTARSPKKTRFETDAEVEGRNSESLQKFMKLLSERPLGPTGPVYKRRARPLVELADCDSDGEGAPHLKDYKDPLYSDPGEYEDVLNPIRCRCGVEGTLLSSQLPEWVVQCGQCMFWSHFACQRSGFASLLPDDEHFRCHRCALVRHDLRGDARPDVK